ncbi:GNAT family N-acetyltransferase [Jannaschia aquimarina]|uniref:YsnE protein n=1 Tax=Jannaschia aquimarina TaxID=935700 RepID=A0A0D1DBW6_9RHOB|nr:GNAT family N-acetyltransferase [Jannaschia aquimarina]KIT17498.1 putative N-acetyltransferase YsnE [Jannaschia aquimarina]SNS74478.1 Acetyltransferase, GNAT family [Jannaschia aquimarina]
MDIRPSTIDDVPAVARLLKENFPPLLRGAYDERTLTEALPIITRPQPELIGSGRYWTAWDGDELLGAGGWSVGGPQGQETGSWGHVRHFITSRNHLRRGVASAIMQNAMVQARAAGVAGLHCFSTLTATAFYRTMGFIGEKQFRIAFPEGPRFPAVEMSQPL